MIVKLRSDEKEIKKHFKLRHLAYDKDYLALGLNFDNENSIIYVSIFGEGNDLVSYNIEYFDIVDSRIPENYLIEKYYRKNLSLYPQEITSELEDDYHNAFSEAEEIFINVHNKIALFHDRPDLIKTYQKPPVTAQDLLRKYAKKEKSD